MIAISTDDRDTSQKFKESLKAPFHFVADPKATIVNSYDVKGFLFTIAKRVTFVVGPGLEVLAIQEGGDAIEPAGAVKACSIKPPEGLKYVTGAADAGVTWTAPAPAAAPAKPEDAGRGP